MGIESIQDDGRKNPLYAIQNPLICLAAGLDMHETDHAKRKTAGFEWVTSGNAQKFSAYMKAHPEEKTDPGDEDAVRELWEKINRTVH